MKPRPSIIGDVAILSLASILLTNLRVCLLADYLKYDASDVPALLAGLTLSPWVGVAILVAKNLVYMTIHFQPQGFSGIICSLLAGATMVMTAGRAVRRGWSNRVALLLGVVTTTLVMSILLKADWPFHPGLSDEVLLKTVLPFNFLKATLNASIVFSIHSWLSRRPGAECTIIGSQAT